MILVARVAGSSLDASALRSGVTDPCSSPSDHSDLCCEVVILPNEDVYLAPPVSPELV